MIKSIHIYCGLSLTKSVSDEDGGGGRGLRPGSSALRTGAAAAAAALGEQTKQVVAKAHADKGVQERVEAAVQESQALGHSQSCL